MEGMDSRVSYAHFSALISGASKAFFLAQRGLCQDETPSPFLFAIVGEALS